MRIHSIFKSINGEVNKYHQGSICIFIRLAGCSLKCRYCFGIVSGRRIPRIICSKVPNKKITEIEKGDFLLTYDDSGKLVETEVTDVLIREVDKWIRLTIHGKQYFVTEEHLFFTTKGLVTAQELKVGDKILHSTPTQKISFNKTILNPMKNPDIARKSVLHRNLKEQSDRMKDRIAQQKKDGTYKSIWELLSEEKKINLRKKISESKVGKRNPNWNPKAPHNYCYLKNQIKDGKINQCSICGKIYKKVKGESSKLDVHHKDGNHLNDRKSNLSVSCESCHYSKHRIGYNFWKGDRVDGKQLQALNGFVVEKIKTFDRNKISPSVRPKPLKVYNFTCYPYNTYLVDYMWVHNCDTIQAQSPDSGKEMNIDEIINEVVKFKNCYRITITGGEPLLQEAELEELVNRLSMEYDISIETNGAHPIKKSWPVSWVVDYKCSSSGMKKKMLLKNYKVVGTHDIIKFVIGDKQDFEDAVYLISRGASIDPVYAFSPMFKDGKPVVEINELLKWIEEEEALEYLRIVINVQIHKFLNIA